ncbi:MAG: YebC/PmpR family DNA-binding transcriptional regulator [Phycisphaerales bacterium]
MAGHSKWANIKHRKARQDAAKGKMWSKCSKAIIVAAKNGGGDPSANLTLRYAIDDARAANMPKDTIEKAIKKGTGELEGAASYEEVRYEGYGPNGVAIIVDCLTDNVNRTAPEIKKIFERANGNLGVPGSVAFGFRQRGLLTFDASSVTEEQIMEAALEAGADDVESSDGYWEVYTEPTDFMAVKQGLEDAGFKSETAEITMIPQTTVECAGANAEKVLRLMETLEEHDDVQKVYANFDIPEGELANLEN